jgi:lipid-A-disaccharide synthase
VRPRWSRQEFFKKHELDAGRPLIAVLPGSRRGEAGRHLPALRDAIMRLERERSSNWVLPAAVEAGFFRQKLRGAPVRVIEGESWDALAHAELALAASGTVTVEAALLGTPLVTFYKVTGLSWLAGKFLVEVPFYCMVNLIAGRAVVPELMQSQMTGERIAAEARKLLADEGARAAMRAGLAEVRARLAGGEAAPERAAAIVQEIWEGRRAHVS